MATTITVPDSLAIRLQQQALAQQRSIEAVALDLLATALDTLPLVPNLTEIVNRIQAVLPNPQNIRPATGSLAAALRSAPPDHLFDLEQWEHEWQAVEAEIRAMTEQDNRSAGGDHEK